MFGGFLLFPARTIVLYIHILMAILEKLHHESQLAKSALKDQIIPEKLVKYTSHWLYCHQ